MHNRISELSIDIETYSDVDLKKCGVYRYCQSPNFDILLFGVSVDNGPVTVYDLASGENVPDHILKALTDDTVIKCAYNASFERVCLSAWLKKNYPDLFHGYGSDQDTVRDYLNPVSWRCTLVRSAYFGLPLSLKMVGSVLNLDKQKIEEGKDLIRYFCSPCRPTKANGERTRNLPEHAPEKWEAFKNYNKRDVEVEMAIKARLASSPVPEFIWDEYCRDQIINDRGILVDLEFVKNAIRFDEISKAEISDLLQKSTGIANPNSVDQMKKWLSTHNMETDALDKKAVARLIASAPPEIASVLSLRQKLAKTSVKKYQAMMNAVCSDGRARGMFMFYGANRTGRWASRIIQLQNLPQNHMEDLSEARDLVLSGDYNRMSALYDDIPDTLSQLIRTSFIARPGYHFYVADFSAIEARVLSHLAGEIWRTDVFRNNGDIYCASASAMFHVPVEKHGVNSHLRQKGKIAELALGYGGSTGALKAMGALEMGFPENELPVLVDRWRQANPNIVQFWSDVDNAVKTVVSLHTHVSTHGITFLWKGHILYIILPSGRRLSYIRPKLCENRFGGKSVSYEGIGKDGKWERLESYGPKFVENIVQAVSRDLLANSMKALSDHYICGHVHDELIIECPDGTSLDDICNKMAKPPAWMPDILLRADGYITDYYKKE